MRDKATVARNLLDTYSTRELADLLAECFFTEANLHRRLEQAEARADACQQEAQIWKQEARTHSATIAEIYQELTGKTGEPGDWHGARPVKAAVLRKQAEAVEAAISDDETALFFDREFVRIDDLEDYAQRLRQQADEIEGSGTV